jgi:hypothetical protein
MVHSIANELDFELLFACAEAKVDDVVYGFPVNPADDI